MKDEKKPEDLRKRTKQFAIGVLLMVDLLPNRPRYWNLTRQISRSATSVGANYREAHRARSDAEFVSKTGDILRELDETDWWLELLQEVTENEPVELNLVGLQKETNELLAIFTTISKRVKARL